MYRHTAGGPPTEGLYAHYDLSTELGKGSFATVRKAMSRATGKWYAVKMIQGSRNVRNHGHTRNSTFAREIGVMEKLKHPNICELVEVFFQDNNDISMSFSTIFTIVSTLLHMNHTFTDLVLELVEGGDLLEYILKNEGLCKS